MRRYLPSSLLVCAMLLFFASSAAAQHLRPEGTFFIKPRAGLSEYSGDRDPGLTDFHEFDVDGKFPWSGAVELGYQFTPAFSVSGAYQIADYPTIMPEDWYTRRHTGQLLLRFMAGASSSPVAPYVELGGHLTRGYTQFRNGEEVDDYHTGVGPVVGLGLDFALNDRTSITLGWQTNFDVTDFNSDGAEGPADPGEAEHQWYPEGYASPQIAEDIAGEQDEPEDFFSEFDALSTLQLGLKLNFESAFTPVEVMSVDCPASLEVGESATFTATVNDDVATPPIQYDWDFGDGTSGSGLLATHSFSEAGTFTVTFSATNDGQTATETCVVEVQEPPVPAEIASIDASPQSFEVCEPTTVEFSSSVEGDEPITYRWDFGDGTTGQGANPSHVYEEPGTYTVTLRASNDAGSSTQSITIQANECIPEICEEVTELNPVFFERNSSTLSEEAQSALEENLEILEQCPDICTRIEGFASAAEQDPDDLSQARADAVAQFYEDNGIESDRLNPVGMGAAGGSTSKKSGNSEFRRADSIPVNCDDLDM